jgi:hypothetical protein
MFVKKFVVAGDSRQKCQSSTSFWRENTFKLMPAHMLVDRRANCLFRAEKATARLTIHNIRSDLP